MRTIDPSEHEFVAKVWLELHQGYPAEYVANHWERVQLVAVPPKATEDDYFYCDGRRYRVTNDWLFPSQKSSGGVPEEMVRAAQPGWLDTRPAGYATAVIADSEVQAFEDTRFMSDDELMELTDGDKLPFAQRAAIWALLALLCGIVFALIALLVMGPK